MRFSSFSKKFYVSHHHYKKVHQKYIYPLTGKLKTRKKKRVLRCVRSSASWGVDVRARRRRRRVTRAF